MKKVIRLRESDLTRIVKQVINELNNPLEKYLDYLDFFVSPTDEKVFLFDENQTGFKISDDGHILFYYPPLELIIEELFDLQSSEQDILSWFNKKFGMSIPNIKKTNDEPTLKHFGISKDILDVNYIDRNNTLQKISRYKKRELDRKENERMKKIEAHNNEMQKIINFIENNNDKIPVCYIKPSVREGITAHIVIGVKTDSISEDDELELDMYFTDLVANNLELNAVSYYYFDFKVC